MQAYLDQMIRDGAFAGVPKEVVYAIAMVLVALVVDMAAKDGACAFHAPIASEMRAAQSLVNLFKHEGFAPVGCIMGRRL